MSPTGFKFPRTCNNIKKVTLLKLGKNVNLIYLNTNHSKLNYTALPIKRAQLALTLNFFCFAFKKKDLIWIKKIDILPSLWECNFLKIIFF